ncbi:MAG: hypothetical protein ABJ256_04235 [Nisaea sp.]|uniref:hypothetical protein n=1 Tax=Nisaea sp. TaxID=2024842 RepID=UPI0032996E11
MINSSGTLYSPEKRRPGARPQSACKLYSPRLIKLIPQTEKPGRAVQLRTTNAPTSAKAEDLIADPSTSQWLRDALRTALSRDPADAANDAEILAAVVVSLCDESLAKQVSAKSRLDTGSTLVMTLDQNRTTIYGTLECVCGHRSVFSGTNAEITNCPKCREFYRVDPSLRLTPIGKDHPPSGAGAVLYSVPSRWEHQQIKNAFEDEQ